MREALAPLFMIFAANGLRAPDGLVWKDAHHGSDGALKYSLHPDFKLRLQGPRVVRHGDGTQIIAPTLAAAEKIGRAMQAKRGGRLVDGVEKEDQLPINKIRLRVRVGSDERRLAVKVLTALLRRYELDACVDLRLLAWLVAEGGDAAPPWQVAVLRFGRERWMADQPGPSHFAYVEGQSCSRRVVGLLRLCDFWSLYLTLSRDYSGHDFALMGRLDLFDGSEFIAAVEPTRLQLPSSTVPTVMFGLDQVMSRQAIDRMTGDRLGRLPRVLVRPSWLEARLLMGI